MSPQVLSHDTDNIKPALVNRRSGVALAMRHRQQCTTNYGLTALGREMSIPPMLQWSMAHFTFTCQWQQH